MLPPDKALLSQIYKGNDQQTVCRVCSTGHRDTYIFRKGWPVTEVVDVEPEVSVRLVAEGACACLCNRCGQAFRKRDLVLDTRTAMIQTYSEFAQDDDPDVDDARQDSQHHQQSIKRQKSFPHSSQNEPTYATISNTPQVSASPCRKGRPKQCKSHQQALAKIAAATANDSPTEYAGYAVTKIASEASRFSFFWLQKNNKSKPLLVSVGVDKRKSGHFVYQKAPGLPDNVEYLSCTSRPQVLAWILTNFSVPNRQLSARVRKELPVISLQEAYDMVGLPQPKALKSLPNVVQDNSRGMVRTATAVGGSIHGVATRTPVKSSKRLARAAAAGTESTAATGAPKLAEFLTPKSDLPSPLDLPNLSTLTDIPSPSDLLPAIPADMILSRIMIPTSMNETNPSRSSEEPEMEAIEVVRVRCGACGLSNHQTPDCPLQGGDGVSISTSRNTSRNDAEDGVAWVSGGSGGLGSGGQKLASDRAGGDGRGGNTTCRARNIDNAFALTTDLLHNIGCWSEVNSPDKADTYSGFLSEPPSATEACIDMTWATVLSNPNSQVEEIEAVLFKLDKSKPSLEELAGSGIVGTVAHLLATSPEKRVSEVSRALCHKWRTQAEQAMQDLA